MMFTDTGYSVSELTERVRDVLKADEALQDVWVSGEISEMTRASSGHWYFTLKDAQAQVRCVMFRSAASRQSVKPQIGDAVRIRGSIGVYEARGAYQFYAEIMRPAGGVGDLYRQFEALKARLSAEGLFDEGRKRPLPAGMRRVGVVTSPQAAAFQDVLNVLGRRLPLMTVLLSPTLVQGAEAPPRIVRALEKLYARADELDVILVIRGGGSIEDLWCFNDESVARTIADSPRPIVSGVGHETDFTIADFVADVRAPTPSAAAEIITPISAADYQQMLQGATLTLQQVIDARLDAQQRGLDERRRELAYRSPLRTVATMRQRLDDITARLSQQQQRRLALLRERLTARDSALRAAHPDALLKRGYAIVTRQDDGQRVARPADAPPGTPLTIRLAEGQLKAQVHEGDPR